MSVYQRRYGVHANRTSHYTDDPAEALRVFRTYQARADARGYTGAGWIDEGYGDERDGPNDTTMVTRRTTGTVLLSTLEFRVQRRAVAAMLADMKRAS